MITEFTVKTGDQMTADWLQVWMGLFATVRDGFYFTPDTKSLCSAGQTHNCTSKLTPTAAGPPSSDNSGAGGSGYTPEWYARIAAENGEHYAMPADFDEEAHQRKMRVMDKSQRRAHA